MKRTKQLLLIVAFSLLCGQAYAQDGFIEIDPESLGIDLEEAPFGNAFTRDFDISSDLELAENSVILRIENGFLNGNGNSFTVSDSEETTFSIVEGSVAVLARLSHGSNLGGANAVAQDGIRTAPGESFTFVSDLDDGFEVGNGIASGDGELFIEFVGDPPATGAASNSNNFVFESDGAFTELDVFTTNTSVLNNNFGFSVALVPVPEPASGLVLTCVVGSFLMRRKRS